MQLTYCIFIALSTRNVYELLVYDTCLYFEFSISSTFKSHFHIISYNFTYIPINICIFSSYS